MVRIHVIRASRLLAGIAGILLAGIVIWLLAGALADGGGGEKAHTARMETEAEAASALFAEADVISASFYTEADRPSRVLIYHTHTHEAYKQTDGDVYAETAAWRTRDNGYNVVRVGERLAEELTERGFTVIHDVTDHELNDLSTAYARSLETVLNYDGIDIYIDLHRDAYNANGSGNPPRVTVNGENTARLMFLVGNGQGFQEKEYCADNYECATILTSTVNEIAPGLCRPVMVKDGRYNQHVSPRSLLVEVGHNENLLTEALAAMPYLAEAMKTVFLDGSAPLNRVTAPNDAQNMLATISGV